MLVVVVPSGAAVLFACNWAASVCRAHNCCCCGKPRGALTGGRCRRRRRALPHAAPHTLPPQAQLIEGRGRIVDAHTVDVGGKRYTAKHILIATGATSYAPPLPGAELAINSDQVLELPSLPKRMTIIGGGYIALEFAGIFHRLGCDVQLVCRYLCLGPP